MTRSSFGLSLSSTASTASISPHRSILELKSPSLCLPMAALVLPALRLEGWGAGSKV